MNLINRLDDYLMREQGHAKRSHYPSDLTSCVRQLAYKWRGEEKTNPPTPGNYLKMAFGNAAEDIIRKWLWWELDQGGFIDFDEQVEVTGESDLLDYPIHGYMDFVVHTEAGKFGIELKSSFGRGVRGVKADGPKPEHLIQVYCYLRFSDLDKIYLIYVGRDDGYRTQFCVTMNDGQMFVDGEHYPVDWDVILTRLIEAERSIDSPVLPVREYKAAIKGGELRDLYQKDGVKYASDWQCRYCDWKDKCWGSFVQLSAKKGGCFYGEEEV
jgi:hypothetical protein